MDISIIDIIKEDYQRLLSETGKSDIYLKDLSNDVSKFTESLDNLDDFTISESAISGKGVFVNKSFSKGDIIGNAVTGDKKTILGRFVNHSPFPNAEYLISGSELLVVAKCDIDKGDELLYDYRQGAELNGIVLDKNKYRDEKIDQLESVMLESFEVVDCPISHIFTPGLYARQMFLKAGTLITSKIHKTEHPYIISKGKVSVWVEEENEVVLESPYTGITKIGTRRVIYAWEDTIWTTFHANPDDENTEQIEDRIIEKHINPLLTEQMKNKMLSVKKGLETELLIY